MVPLVEEADTAPSYLDKVWVTSQGCIQREHAKTRVGGVCGAWGTSQAQQLGPGIPFGVSSERL